MLSLQFLDQTRVLRDGAAVELPPSKKTRALLAYLVVTGRAHRRDRLCSLLWNLPDDPRGALRWSLSKLRRLVDEPTAARIVADRETVRFDPKGAHIDVQDLRRRAADGLENGATKDLASLAKAFGGDFLAGLDIQDSHEFHAWCIAERAELQALQARVLRTLVERLKSRPEAALPFARSLVQLEAHDEEAWAGLIQLLAALGRRQEAEDQCALGQRVLKEAGVSPTGALLRVNLSRAADQEARKPAPAPNSTGLDHPPEESGSTDRARAPAEQLVQYCFTDDTVRVAYAAVGSGPPIVKTANWLTHLDYDWDSPVWRHWMGEFSRNHRLIRYDHRGNGLSDWQVADLSFEAYVRDLETVVEAAGLERFALLGLSLGCAIAIAYAARHPERLTHLVLYGGYARGWAVRASPQEIAQRGALRSLIKHGWGQDNPAFRQVFTSRYIPDATEEQMRWMNELQLMTTSPGNALFLDETASMVDVRPLLPQVKVPTLIMHCRDDAVVPFAEGQLLADSIAGSRFVALEGRNHIILEPEPAWERFVMEVRDFLGSGVQAPVGETERMRNAGPELPRRRASNGQLMEPIARPSPVHGAPGMAKPTIAVVPFKCIGMDPEHEIFAEGVTEDLSTMLSRVLGLFVVARDSASYFKDRPSCAMEAARGLGVRYALHGSVRMSADRIIVNAYLLDSHTATEIWSDRYDVPHRDVFAVQDEITTHVVRALQVELLEGEQARVWHHSTTSVAAWSWLTQGLAQYKRQTKEGVQKARALFEKATEVDPTYAAAWAWLAYAHWHDARFLWVDEPEKALARATTIAGRALELDANLSEVHAVLGAIRVLRREYDEAIAAARKAVALAPNGSEATALLAFVLTRAGHPEEAARTAERAIEFCPLHSGWYLDALAHAQLLLRQFDKAVMTYRQAIMRLPDYIMPRIGLAACYAEMGRLAEARAQAQEVLRIDPDFSIRRHTAMSQYRLPKHTDRRLRALRVAGLP